VVTLAALDGDEDPKLANEPWRPRPSGDDDSCGCNRAGSRVDSRRARSVAPEAEDLDPQADLRARLGRRLAYGAHELLGVAMRFIRVEQGPSERTDQSGLECSRSLRIDALGPETGVSVELRLFSPGREPRLGLVDIENSPTGEPGVDPGGGEARVQLETGDGERADEPHARVSSRGRAGGREAREPRQDCRPRADVERTVAPEHPVDAVSQCSRAG
jgi:hypothetical protein